MHNTVCHALVQSELFVSSKMDEHLLQNTVKYQSKEIVWYEVIHIASAHTMINVTMLWTAYNRKEMSGSVLSTAELL